MNGVRAGDKLRVVFTTASAYGSGMTASAICEEGIEPVGFFLDHGPLRLSSRSIPAEKFPKYIKAWQLFRLAVRYPEHYVPLVMQHLGYQPGNRYEQYRSAEKALIDEILQQCGEVYRLDLTGLLQRFPTFEELALRLKAPFYRVNNLNADEVASSIRSLEPDVIVSLGDRIIKPHILQIPTLGVLNGHASMLPRFRGTTTEFWQLYAGEETTGVTIHWMAPKVDEGAIVVQESWPIPTGSTHWQLRAVSQFKRLPLWRKAIRLVKEGYRGVPQPKSDEKTYGQPQWSDEYELYIRRRHRQLRKA